MGNSVPQLDSLRLSSENISYILCPELESIHNLHGHLSNLRQDFFGSNKRQNINMKCEFMGLPAVVKASIANFNFSYKSIVNQNVMDSSIKTSAGFVVVRRDFNDNICGKIYYNRNLYWEKTEYYNPDKSNTAITIIQPDHNSNAVELLTFNENKSIYQTKKYYPIACGEDFHNKNEIEEQFGMAKVYVKLKNCICLYYDSTIISELIGENSHQLNVDKSSQSSLNTLLLDPQDNINEVEEEIVEEAPVQTEDMGEYLSYFELEENDNSYNFTGRIRGGKKQGRARLETKENMTVYDGCYKDNLKDGFGNLYTDNGDLAYSGFWKDDQKNGGGVSYREHDQAIHVANWDNGTPNDFVTLFDTDANFTYAGKIVDNVRVGAGVEYDKENDIFIISKNNGDGTPAQKVTIFDSEGNLVYTGGYSNGHKNGFGIEFDTKGDMIYRGEYKDDEYVNGVSFTKIGNIE